MEKERKTLGLVLGSGGAKGACHAGVLKAFIEHGIPIDYISGCSMGSVVGGVFASGVKIDEIERVLRELKQSQIIDFNVMFISKGGLVKGASAETLIKSHLLTDVAEETLVPFSCVAVDLLSGKLEVLDSGSLSKNIRSSMSIPSVFCPHEYNGKIYVDGGVLCRLPFFAVRKHNPDVVVGVDALGEVQPIKQYKNIFDIILRVFDIVDWNNTIGHEGECDVLITPDNYESSAYHAKYIAPSIDAGYKEALKHIPKIKELLGI